MVQVSGDTANNFSTPVVYTVTAADASTQDYTVTVTANLGGSWTQKKDFGGVARSEAVAFGILNGKGYMGTGWNGTTYYSDSGNMMLRPTPGRRWPISVLHPI